MGNPVSTSTVRRGFRGVSVLALFALFTLLLSPIALADTIYNNLDDSPDPALEVLPLTTTSGSVTIAVRPANGDGKNGCNITGTTQVSFTVASNAPSVATVSPSIVHFLSCSWVEHLTVTPGIPGTANVNFTQVANTTGGTFDDAPASFQVVVSPPADSTAPVITPNVVGTLGENGWYVSDVNLSWTVVDNESPVTASTGCGAVSLVADQSATAYTCSATSAGGTNSQSVTIMRDATAPTISGSAAPPVNGAGWNNTSVDVTFTCGDNLSGVVSCGPDTTLSSDGAGQSVSGTVTDAAGNTASTSVSGINVDATDPTINADVSPAANGNGWRNTDVTVSFTCADTGGSGIESCSSNQTLGEGLNQSAIGTAIDVAGNSNSVTVTNINVDMTVPTISGDRTPAGNADGWNNGPVEVAFTCDDALSTIDTCLGNATLSTEGAGQSVEGTATDKAGNTATDPVSDINIDLTAPTNIQLTGTTLSNGGTYYFGSVPGAPSGCTADDALSGLKTCSVGMGYGTSVGVHSFDVTATDKAGNTTSATYTYEVLGWTARGFHQPVDMGGVYNTVKAGSTVPLKFEVFAGSTELTSTSIVMGYSARMVSCNGSAEDAVEVTSTGGTSLRYDTTGGQFIQNWQTPKSAGSCYTVTVTLQDGSSITAYFRLK